jgi:hypothetical protein
MGGGNPAMISKIFAISISQARKWKGYAVYTGEKLVVQSIVPITGGFSEWQPTLAAEILHRKQNGFIVFVEEKTDHFAQFATQFDFEAVDQETGRINYYEALDWYFALDNMGLLILPEDLQSHAIREKRIDRQHDEKGRTKYVVDWESFSGAQRVLLMCVMAAVGMHPVSDVYLEHLYASEEIEDEPNLVSRFIAITTEYDNQRAEQLDRERELLNEQVKPRQYQ